MKALEFIDPAWRKEMNDMSTALSRLSEFVDTSKSNLTTSSGEPVKSSSGEIWKTASTDTNNNQETPKAPSATSDKNSGATVDVTSKEIPAVSTTTSDIKTGPNVNIDPETRERALAWAKQQQPEFKSKPATVSTKYEKPSSTTTTASISNRPTAKPSDISTAGNKPTSPTKPTEPYIGSLSSRFESGPEGSSAIGWDSQGGTSYGKYQISSKQGTMDEFMKYLKQSNPEAYAKLSKAGTPDSGKTGNFAQEWKNLANQGKIQQNEYEFIKATHYDPQVARLKDPSLKNMIDQSPALQDVMWSTGVQHKNYASQIFNKVYRPGMSEQDLIKAVYAERATRFPNATPRERKAVQNRLKQEAQVALALSRQPRTVA